MKKIVEQIFIDADIPFETIGEIKKLHGGDINEVLLVSTNQGQYCLKINMAKQYPGMLRQESSGLNVLRENSEFRIPKIYCHGIYSNYQYLILEYIQSGVKKIDFWTDFGHRLADLHRTSNDKYGFHEDNYIGSLIQKNTMEAAWPEFFENHRIMPQIKLGVDNAIFSTSIIGQVENLCAKFSNLFPEELPSLIHGDLWSGNYMIDEFSNPCLIDPATYYGHREMDIAMMHLFGGFNDKLFEAYNDVFPLEKEWKTRIHLCNLYPILVHANLFGGHYVEQVSRIIDLYS